MRRTVTRTVTVITVTHSEIRWDSAPPAAPAKADPPPAALPAPKEPAAAETVPPPADLPASA
jgi:hypothetical protein